MVKLLRKFKAPPFTEVFLKKVFSQREKTISFCYDMQAHLGRRNHCSVCKTSMPWPYSCRGRGGREYNSFLALALVIATISNKKFETDSSFHVKQCTMERVWLLFFRAFLLVLAKLLFCRGVWALGYLPWNLDTFLKFPSFLRSYILSRLATREATCIYHVYK